MYIIFEFSPAELWDDNEEDLEIFDNQDNCDDGTSSAGSTTKTLTMWLVFFLLHLQSKHYIPDKAIDSLLKFLSTLFGVIGRFSQIGKEISECFPKTSYALQRYADIVRPIKSFVVCRDCKFGIQH